MREAAYKRSYKTGADYRVIILYMDGTLYYQAPLRICMSLKLCVHYAAHLNRFRELLRLRDFHKLHILGVRL
ncbi:MAG: hypothetical protein Ta2B_30310 [Termitinemataceae bacterium]|nr:MAG: hypothetical protein Ta2B_30310 [Termitinemataceae bacterium]